VQKTTQTLARTVTRIRRNVGAFVIALLKSCKTVLKNPRDKIAARQPYAADVGSEVWQNVSNPGP
jgi:hypothetical protein